MILNPIIPLWLMGIICIALLFFKRKGIFNYIRQIVIIVLIFVINMRIMVQSGNISNMTSNVDVLFVVDNTISMLAEDYNGDDRRIDAVRSDCNYIMKELAGASFAVAVFESDIKKDMPYTIDTDMVNQVLESLEGESYYYAQGTSLDTIMSKMDTVLENKRDTYKVVFFISDGEIINGDKLKSHGELKEYVDTGAVLGYGTEKGGVMRPRAYAGDTSTPEILYYYDDYDRKKGISKIDESNLKKIAKDLGVDYVHATSQKDIKNIVNEIKKDVSNNADFEVGDGKAGYSETYYYFVVVLLALLVFDFIYYKKKA